MLYPVAGGRTSKDIILQVESEERMTFSIRPFVEADLETADAILKLAFRGSASRLPDLRFYRQIQSDGWFLALLHEHPVGLVVATNYGALAYVGLMAVHPEAQRQGVGLALMQFLLAGLDRQQVPLVVLDASEAGRPLYEKLGFVAHDETLVFQRQGRPAGLERPPHIQSISVHDLDELVQWDLNVFGADRRKVFQALLNTFPDRAFMLRDEQGRVEGYLFAQKSRIGPWVMLHPSQAEALLQAALALPYEEAVSVTVPAVNPEALALLQRYGFERVRTNRHMSRGGGAPPGQRQKVYAQTSLAVG
jgi:ribosomal protein S18 acetylase RimI-like enzyme